MWDRQACRDLSALIEENYGIHCDEKKVQSNVLSLEGHQRAAGFRTDREFLTYLRVKPQSRELQTIAELFLIHETYFFREFRQLQFFAEELLPKIIETKIREKDYFFHLWSAACSTGEEAYTLGIILNEMIDRRQIPSVRITATDLDRESIDFARKGVYSGRALKDLPPVYLRSYFKETEAGKQKVNIQLQGLCDFSVGNLLLPPKEPNKFDVVFCRNVLIYFAPDIKQKILENIHRALRPGGVLLIGSTDSIAKLTVPFQAVSRLGMTYYQKIG